MPEPTVRHFYVKIYKSLVHLVQYGYSESLVRSTCSSPSSSCSSINQSTSSTSSSITASSTSVATVNVPSMTTRGKARKLIIFVPGNPGVLGIYHDFLVMLYKTLAMSSGRADNPVILAIGHNNFDHPDHCDYRAEERICVDESELSFVERTKLDAYPDPHEIELQVMNKLVVLKRLLKCDLGQSNDCKLVFVGHSIGCYVILRLLQDRTLARLHAGSVLIHPALENLATTEQGAIIGRYFFYKLDHLMRLVALALEKLTPKQVRLSLTKWYCPPGLVNGSSSIVLESIAQMVCPKTLNALIRMAKSEFVHVKNLDHISLIQPHVNKLKLIYSTGDHWVNPTSRLELAQLYPELYIEEQQTLHAFVMDPNVVTNYAIKIGVFVQEMFE